jgi:predicted DNA-binding transcriptional regulator YafY
LIAFCQLRKDYRNFRIDRILTSEVLSERFHEIHPGLQTFLSQTRTERELTEIVIHLDKEAYPFLGDQPYYHGFVSQKMIEDKIEMTFLTSSVTGFAHWFLMLGQSADIVSPPVLTEIVKQKLTAISERLSG